MSHARVPAAAEAFFEKVATAPIEHPIITAEFTTRWTRKSYRKRISASWARKLRQRGVTHVELTANGHRADFRIDELVR